MNYGLMVGLFALSAGASASEAGRIAEDFGREFGKRPVRPETTRAAIEWAAARMAFGDEGELEEQSA